MIPSINAVTYVAHALRKMQHGAMKDAIVFERAGDEGCAKSLRLQAHDMHQVATFLEEHLERRKPAKKNKP